MGLINLQLHSQDKTTMTTLRHGMSAPRIAYLEISPRQTGKTERLVRHAKSCLAAGKRVCFVTLQGAVEDLRHRLPGAFIWGNDEEVPCREDDEGVVWFYDEFDWLDSTKIQAGAYYATTPKFLRTLGEQTAENDLLLELIEANDRQHCRYTWPVDLSDMLKEARASYSPEEFRLLYLGEFLK